VRHARLVPRTVPDFDGQVPGPFEGRNPAPIDLRLVGTVAQSSTEVLQHDRTTVSLLRKLFAHTRSPCISVLPSDPGHPP